MKKRLPKEVWIIFQSAVNHAENIDQLKKMRLQLERLKNGGYVEIQKYNTFVDEIIAKRIELQPFE